MKLGPITKIILGVVTSILITSCTSTSGGTQVAGGVSSGANPVCVGTNDCQVKMNAARNWVTYNTGFGFQVDTDQLLETGGWGVSELTSVRIRMAPIGGGRSWLVLEIACGSDESSAGYDELGCPDPTAASASFQRMVGAAQ